ncbi:IS1595-like element ISSod11 family transposase [Shewanella xiamenensis]|uniref:IS1595-like element ISSod11 family transposase n=1 Tax=Shewanella xiamenensis TaxID=332186 RepID=UPI00244B1FE9|nr:IS1595-like element ISSod11 family transposase [Shewanella xiamenensis]MDH1313317.1 IS1595-like element ISSod11 family transposase [Shewanella xiamenensis]
MKTSSYLLKAGVDYPTNWDEFVDWFHDEQSCTSYLYALRWPNGFICPSCSSHQSPYQLSNGKLKCHACRFQCSVTSSTLFDKTRTPMKSWFAAVWFITNQKNGVSALGVQRLLGLGGYQTAWSLMHKLRYAMVDPERDKLSGIVEVDETLIGGVIPKSSIKNQQGKRKAIVLVAVELLSPSGFGRIRLRQVESATKEHIHQFIQDVIEPGSTICSDGSQAYKQIDKKGYKHNRMVHLGSSVPAHETMAGVHRVSSLCKRWLLGRYQGAVKAKQLDYYLDEFTFRFNRRKSDSRGLLFYRLLEQAVRSKPITYQSIKNP